MRSPNHWKFGLRVNLAALGALGLGVLAAGQPAFAQLPDIIDRTITRRVEDTVSSTVDRRVTDGVERAVQGAVEGAVDNSLTRGVTRTLETTLEPVTNLVDSTVDRLTTLPLLPFREVTLPDAWRAVDHEWIALVPPERVAALQIPSIRILSRTQLPASGLVMVRVQVSDADDAAGRAQQVLRDLGATAADRNHVYSAQEGLAEDADRAPAPEEPQAQSGGGADVRIGLIDTAVNTRHAAFRQSRLETRDFVEQTGARPTEHGTGIAALLVGGERGHVGLLPRARLYAASAFYQGQSGATGATTSALIAALDWMASQNVAVVNMSLAGPPNEALRAMIDRMTARGMLIVAAVGNEGPAGRALYPAAYEPVVAVTAVDRNNTIYRWANQGPQVDLAAWGVRASVAKDTGGYHDESGTSFAAPIVAAMLAQRVAAGSPRTALEALIRSAEDLGARGRDNVFGYGLVRPQ
jgi:subtilisin family serine protease